MNLSFFSISIDLGDSLCYCECSRSTKNFYQERNIFMLKKLLSSILALSFIFTLSLSSFAASPSQSIEDFTENGKLVDTKIITTNSEAEKLEIYSSVKELPASRSTEQEYEKTLSVVARPANEKRYESTADTSWRAVVKLKIRFVTRSYADGLPEYEGYKLSRIMVYTYESAVDLDTLAGLNHGIGSGANPVYYDLSGYESPTTITKYPGFTNYVADVGDCVVGARLYFSYKGTSDNLELNIFDNII